MTPSSSPPPALSLSELSLSELSLASSFCVNMISAFSVFYWFPSFSLSLQALFLSKLSLMQIDFQFQIALSY